MAWLHEREGQYRIRFRSGGKPLQVGLGAVPRREAEACLARLEENLRLFERGRLDAPPGANLGRALLSDGKLAARPVLENPRTLAELFAHYREHAPVGAKEKTTLATERIHMAHLLRLLGGATELLALDAAALQRYASQRSAEPNRKGEPLSQATVRKELATLTTIANNWGLPQGFLRHTLSLKHVVYVKSRAKAPFQTWDQIERRITRQQLAAADARRLWESVFLSVAETRRLVEHVASRVDALATAMFQFAAYTGARRSEIVRAEIEDVDFATGQVILREKKRDRDKELTFRSVPLAGELREGLQRWLDGHKTGATLFANPNGTPLTPRQAAQIFRRSVKKSRWSVLPGWHTLRHSFASCLAAAGVDARVIDSFMGHQTEAMRQRYRHLFPENRAAAIRQAFGA